MKLIVGISGATGAAYGVGLLRTLKTLEVETPLIMSRWGAETLKTETGLTEQDIAATASGVYDNDDLAAPISSASFRTDGMIVLPCSMKTLAAIACGYDDSLMARAAGVMLKERRRLVLCPRETPLSAIHLENMLKLARLGVSIVPPMPVFYNGPQTIDDLVNSHIMKVLDQFGLDAGAAGRWS